MNDLYWFRIITACKQNFISILGNTDIKLPRIFNLFFSFSDVMSDYQRHSLSQPLRNLTIIFISWLILFLPNGKVDHFAVFWLKWKLTFSGSFYTFDVKDHFIRSFDGLPAIPYLIHGNSAWFSNFFPFCGSPKTIPI